LIFECVIFLFMVFANVPPVLRSDGIVTDVYKISSPFHSAPQTHIVLPLQVYQCLYLFDFLHKWITRQRPLSYIFFKQFGYVFFYFLNKKYENDSAFVYRNNLSESHPEKANYLRIGFKGSRKNVQGLGASVGLYYGKGLVQVYEHSPYRVYLSTVEPIAHFGLGDNPQIDSAVVVWPNGKKQTLKNLKANQTVYVSEGSATQINIPVQSNPR